MQLDRKSHIVYFKVEKGLKMFKFGLNVNVTKVNKLLTLFDIVVRGWTKCKNEQNGFENTISVW